MKQEIVESRLSKLSARFNLMVFLVAGLMVTNILSGFLSIYALSHQKREIVPFSGNGGYIISDTQVDDRYLAMMTQNFLYTRLNVTPKNVHANHQALLGFIEASAFADFKKQLRQEEEAIIEREISSHFNILDISPDITNLQVRVNGLLRRHVGYRALKEEEKTYLIQYAYHNGTLSITRFTEERGEA